MFTLYKHELKINMKSLLIWSICVGGMCFACILLFSTMEDAMADMAESFAAMGAFSDAFGMSQLSIATLAGFYATEIGTIFALGGAMYAAISSTTMLSKEEDGHTSEFLFTLPVSRGKVVTAKIAAIVTNLFLFNVICVGFCVIGFLALGEHVETKDFILYHGMQFIMQLQMASICLAISACVKKNKLGVGLGVVMLFYAYDLIARVIPDLSDYKVISPFSYANASDIFSTGETSMTALTIGCVILLAGILTSYIVYTKRDLAS